MTTLRDRQIRHSELMRVLAALEYENPESERSNARRRTEQTKEEMKHLETIALYMVSGERGDVVASAFDKIATPNLITIFLAKNDVASEQDLEDAGSFLKYLINSKNQEFVDFLPFLVHRSSQNLQIRINKVRNLTRRLRKKLDRQIATYVRRSSTKKPMIFDPETEFPDHDQDLKKLRANGIQSGEQVYDVRNDLKNILDIFEAELTISSSLNDIDSKRLEKLTLAASVFTNSTFFHGYGATSTKTGYTDIAQFWRNLDKLSQFRHITDLGKFVRQHALEFTICWVPASTLTPIHHELDKIKVRSVPEVITELGQEWLQITKTQDKVDELIQDKHRYWQYQVKLRRPEGITISPKLHAEIQIIHALGSLTSPSNPSNFKPQRPIGCSKRSCLQCWLYIKKVNHFLSEEWMTAGDHSWPYDTAALTGGHVAFDPNGECDTYIEDMVSKYALKKVRQLYGLESERPSHFRKLSEEYASASGDSDIEETKRKERR